MVEVHDADKWVESRHCRAIEVLSHSIQFKYKQML